MKTIILVIATVFVIATLCPVCVSQSPPPVTALTPVAPIATTPVKSDLYGVGAAYSSHSDPQVAFEVFQAHLISSGLYNFNVIDCIFQKDATGKIQAKTSFTPGAAQHLRDIGPVKLYALATVGVATGVTTGLSWSAGWATYYDLGKGWGLMGTYRALSLPNANSNNTIQGIFGINISWGK